MLHKVEFMLVDADQKLNKLETLSELPADVDDRNKQNLADRIINNFLNFQFCLMYNEII